MNYEDETKLQEEEISTVVNLINKKLIISAVCIFCTTIILGITAFIWQKRSYEKINKQLEMEIFYLKTQLKTGSMSTINVLSKDSSNSTDYNAYRNEKWELEFKYPSDLILTEISDDHISIERPFISDPEFYDNNFNLSIRVEQLDSEKNLDEFFISKFCMNIVESSYTPNLNESINSCKTLFQETKENFKIQGKNALKAKNNHYVTGRLIVLIDNSGQIIILELGESGEEGSGISNEAINTFNLIIDSIVFTH
jgi:hypothetical protein